MKKIIYLIIIVLFVLTSIFIFSNLNRDGSNLESTTVSDSKEITGPEADSKSDTNGKVYLINEVSQNNSKDSCWLIIDQRVYDVTKYLREHPGGSSEILPFCGKEATDAFKTMNKRNQKSHSPKASAILQDYLIGSIEPIN